MDELKAAPGRWLRLGRFLSETFEFEPAGVLLFSLVRLGYSAWCNMHREDSDSYELKRLLVEAGYDVRQGKIIGICWRRSRSVHDKERELWWSIGNVVKRRGVPAAALRLMREARVGPQWRANGHGFFYNVTDLDAWLARKLESKVAVEATIVSLRHCIAELFTLAKVVSQKSRGGRRIGAAVPVRWKTAVMKWEDVLGDVENWFEREHGRIPSDLASELRRYLLKLGCRETRQRRHDEHGSISRPRMLWGLWPRGLGGNQEYFTP